MYRSYMVFLVFALIVAGFFGFVGVDSASLWAWARIVYFVLLGMLVLAFFGRVYYSRPAQV